VLSEDYIILAAIIFSSRRFLSDGIFFILSRNSAVPFKGMFSTYLPGIVQSDD